MAFPVTPLPVLAGIAPGANPVAPSTWNFTDITSDVREYGGIQITAGRSDETSTVDATRVSATLDCGSGKYSRVNPLSPFYGTLNRGTPISVAVTRIVDTFTRTTSNGLGVEPDSGINWAVTSATFWSTNGSAAQCAIPTANNAAFALHTSNLSGGDDVEVFHTASLSAVTTGANFVSAAVLRYSDVNNLYLAGIEFGAAGAVGVKISRVLGGVFSGLTAVVATGDTYAAGTKVRMRARAIGPTLQVRAWLDGNPEPATWQAQADDSALAGQGVGLYEWRVTGNTNAGTLTSTIDDFRADNIRAVTPVPEWPVRWDQSGRNVTAPITGAGILRRLSQGQTALRSPLYRQLSAQGPHGYWPLEDGSAAVAGSPATLNTDWASQTDVQFGATDAPPGSSASVTLTAAATSKITALVHNPPVTATGYAGMGLFRLATVPGADGNLIRFATTGTVRLWQISIGPTNITAQGFDASGALTVNLAGAHGMNLTRWFAVQLETEESGGTVNWSLIWHQVGSGLFLAITGSYAGTADTIFAFTSTAPVDGTQCCHVWIGPNTLPFVDLTFLAVAAGYIGELASARITRLCREAGIPVAVLPGTSQAMGAQRAATVLDLLRECETTDQGVLYERGAGLGYRPRVARYITPSTTAVLALDFNSGHISAPPEPVDDDQGLKNSIQVTRTNGSSAPAQDLVSIAASGLYEDDVEVNTSNDLVLSQHAYWRLHLGTADGPRWPRIELQLHRNPSLIAAWCKMRIGSRITIANPPAAMAGASLDLIVEGWTETLGIWTWDVVLVCSPASSWQVGAWDATSSRWDLRSSTLNAGVNSAATSLTFKQTDNESWATTGTPYNLIISGEVVTVTAMGARTGTGPWFQTATVTRAVNGIAKSLPAAAPVHVATPGRWAL